MEVDGIVGKYVADALAEMGAWGQLVHALYIETQESALRNRTAQREEAVGPNAMSGLRKSGSGHARL